MPLLGVESRARATVTTTEPAREGAVGPFPIHLHTAKCVQCCSWDRRCWWPPQGACSQQRRCFTRAFAGQNLSWELLSACDCRMSPVVLIKYSSFLSALLSLTMHHLVKHPCVVTISTYLALLSLLTVYWCAVDSCAAWGSNVPRFPRHILEGSSFYTEAWKLLHHLWEKGRNLFSKIQPSLCVKHLSRTAGLL